MPDGSGGVSLTSEPFLSVVVPAFNEESRLAASLDRIEGYMELLGKSFEVIVVDDGSTDQTAEIGRRLSARPLKGQRIRLFCNGENRGKGFSVRRGMLAARGEFALMTDADLSTPIEEFENLEKRLQDEGLDLVFGSRDLEDSDVQVRQPWIRETLGKLFNRLVRLVTALPYRDTQCGFKLFRMKSCRPLFECQSVEGFIFDVEILFVARKWSLKMAEVPVTWRHAEGSKVSVVATAPSTIIDLFRIHLNNARSRYSRAERS